MNSFMHDVNFEFTLIFDCGLLALLYGILTAMKVLSASTGTPKMQEIAAAIQEGAKAYLYRQYMTIAIVGVVIAPVSDCRPSAESRYANVQISQPISDHGRTTRATASTKTR